MSDSNPDYYKVLGVSESATQGEIRKAWLKLARQYHPDTHADDTPEGKRQAEERMKDINEAYSVIGDEKKRKQYDAMRHMPFGGGGNPFTGTGNGNTWSYTWGGGNGTSGIDWDDMLDSLFGKGRATNTSQKTSHQGGNPFAGFDVNFGGMTGTNPLDVDVSMSIPLQTAVTGGKVDVRIPDGRTVSVNVPPHTKNGATIRLKGLGNTDESGHVGNMNVTIGIDLPSQWELDGDDVRGRIPIRFDMAMLGGDTTVVLPSGHSARVRVPKGTVSGSKFQFRNEGLGIRGKCILTTDIQVPKNLTAQSEELLRKLAATL